MGPGVGLHLLIDGQSSWALTNRNLTKYIIDCAREIGMTIVLGPVVAPNPLIQAHAIIAESDISAKHIRGWLFLGVFSCKPFPVDIPPRLAMEQLGLAADYTATVLHRAGTAVV